MSRDSGLTNEQRKERKARYMSDWYKRNPDRVGGYVSKSYYSARDRLIELLGNKCCKCGFSDRRALQFDHIKGDGYKERKRNSGYNVGRLKAWLEDPDLQNKLQLLCANCN